MGRMPPAVRAGLAGERVLFESEGVVVAFHMSGHVPGKTSAGEFRRGYGAFAVTDRRVIGTRANGIAVDVGVAPQPAGPVKLTLEEDGLHVFWDLDRVHPSCRGHMRLHYRQAIPAEDLARFPAREIEFAVDPQKVVRFAGSLKKLPPG